MDIVDDYSEKDQKHKGKHFRQTGVQTEKVTERLYALQQNATKAFLIYLSDPRNRRTTCALSSTDSSSCLCLCHTSHPSGRTDI